MLEIGGEKLTLIHRNSLCACGSGLRFKACCGKLSPLALSASPMASASRELALQKHLSGALFDAIALYDQAIAQDSCDWDALHMRATALYQLGLIDEAREAFSALIATPARELPGFRSNYGLVQSAGVVQMSESSLFVRSEAPPPAIASPTAQDRIVQATTDVRVAVVMPLYNHAAFVAASIESVMAQTRLPDEMIVIDDGSSDDSFRVAHAALANAPFPVRLIARDNRGAHATLNEAIALATCEWIQPLNSDDRLPPQRLERCIMQIASQRNARWGYMRVDCIDTQGHTISSRWDARCKEIYRVQDNAANASSHSHALLMGNASISTGNLFFQKTLWQSLLGFADYRYNHDWDFCLRASRLVEPIVIDELGYLYRIHDRNTIRESAVKARSESLHILATHVAALNHADPEKNAVRAERIEIAYAMDLIDDPLLATARPFDGMTTSMSIPMAHA
jgi:glycosyltransferase involved in cell wall biosynthesis